MNQRFRFDLVQPVERYLCLRVERNGKRRWIPISNDDCLDYLRSTDIASRINLMNTITFCLPDAMSFSNLDDFQRDYILETIYSIEFNLPYLQLPTLNPEDTNDDMAKQS
jgi:hypothetical protein